MNTEQMSDRTISQGEYGQQQQMNGKALSENTAETSDKHALVISLLGLLERPSSAVIIPFFADRIA